MFESSKFSQKVRGRGGGGGISNIGGPHKTGGWEPSKTQAVCLVRKDRRKFGKTEQSYLIKNK